MFYIIINVLGKGMNATTAYFDSLVDKLWFHFSKVLSFTSMLVLIEQAYNERLSSRDYPFYEYTTITTEVS